MRSILWKSLALLGLLLLSVGCTGGDSDEPYVIGAMDALTGVAESYGNPLLQAKLLAVEEINAAGGIDGRMLELIVEDSKCAAQDAIIAYNKLTDVDDVKIILGATCSGSTLGAAPLAEQDGVVMLSASATSPDIASAGDYIFRTAINDLQLGTDIGNTLWSDGIRTIATITESTDYAEGARSTSVARFEELGGSVVAAEGFSSDVIDFRSQLTKLINANPEALLLAAQGEVAGGNHHETGPRVGLRRPHLLGDRAHRARCSQHCRRCRHRPEGNYPQPRPDHHRRQGVPGELPGTVRHRGDAALVPGFRLRRRVHCR